jgi:hypothetical protein
MLKTTPNTTKKSLKPAVGSGDIPKSATLYRATSCIHKHNHNPSLKSLVSTKINQLPEAPQVQVFTLTLWKFSPFPDTPKIFK